MRDGRTWKRAVCLAALIGSLVTLASCREQTVGQEIVPSALDVPQLPDLHQCTRLEVEYFPPPPRFFFLEDTPTYLTPEELQYVQSLRIVEVNDPAFIQGLANAVKEARYLPEGSGPTFEGLLMKITCYHNQERLLSFTRWRHYLVANDNWFETGRGWEGTYYIPPKVKTLLVRAKCAHRLRYLLSYLRDRYVDDGSLPAADKWCDAIQEKLQAEGRSAERIADFFRCPGAQDGPCHYAMNPNCHPGSPKDMVLLFEAKPGWNQHGGPELFAFDHHDPRGGLVLLNNVDWEGLGTPIVRFIRTEEELNQLRWK
jgi:hypothetical protein